MQDVALKHQDIIKKISRYENGVVAETMSNMGLKYPVNYGLSIPQIDKIASALNADNELAKYLWQQNERESKLLSLKIIEPHYFDNEQLAAILNGINNVELAEQAVVSLFAKLENNSEIALLLVKHKISFVKLSGYLLVSRLVHQQKSDETYLFILNEMLNHLPTDEAIYLKRGLASALLKLGLHSNLLKIKVLEEINSLTETRPELFKYLEQEVNHYLLITN